MALSHLWALDSHGVLSIGVGRGDWKPEGHVDGAGDGALGEVGDGSSAAEPC